MNSKEIIQRAIGLEPTPRIPVSLLSAGAWTLNQSGLTLEQALAETPERIAEVIAKTNDAAGCDIVWPGSGYHNLAIRGVGGKIKFRVKGTPDVQEPLLKELSDIGRVRIEQVREDAGICVLVGAAGALAKQIGSRTVVGTSQWAPFTLGGLAFGVERLMRSLYKDKAAVHAVMEFATELCIAYLEPFIDAGVSMISLADPTASGDLVSREQFREYSLPYLTRVAARIKARGVWGVVHICGNTTNRLDLVPLAGADIMSFDYKVNLADARRILGGHIAFAGNMNPVVVMQKQTPEGVAASCAHCIEQASGKSGGYIVMPGCDIPPSVPLANVKAMVQAAHRYN
jgi:uroporphyrinogen decarboxylase